MMNSIVNNNDENNKIVNWSDIGSTILLIIATILLIISMGMLFSRIYLNNKLDAAPSGKSMLNNITMYGIENVRPFEIVENVANYTTGAHKASDEYTKLAVALGEYTESAFYKYAYEYSGDIEKSNEYLEKMNAAREQMQVNSYADYIDANYKKYSE